MEKLNLKTQCSSKMLQVLQRNGLISAGNDYVRAIADVATDTYKLQEVCETIFENDFTKIKSWGDDIDIGEFSEKVQDFLLGALIGSGKSKQREKK